MLDYARLGLGTSTSRSKASLSENYWNWNWAVNSLFYFIEYLGLYSFLKATKVLIKESKRYDRYTNKYKRETMKHEG